MKIKLAILVLTIAVSGLFNPAFAAQLKDRGLRINFQGRLLDENGLSYDGKIDMEAAYYKFKNRNPGSFIYSEKFTAVKVEHGLFRLPLFSGSPSNGSISIDGLSNQDGPFVDIKADGKILVELEPLASALGAIRAEYSKKAEKLHNPLILTSDDIPVHGAEHITTGRIPSGELPKISASQITSGTFGIAQLPDLLAEMVSGGKFTPSVIPSDLSAGMFTTGTLSSGVISQDLLRDGDLVVGTGEIPNGYAIPIPIGFSKSQCSWVVSIREIKGSEGVDQFSLDTDANAVVHCRWSSTDGNYDIQDPTTGCRASYMIICKK